MAMCEHTPEPVTVSIPDSAFPTKEDILEAISAGVRRAFPWSDEVYNAILNGCANGMVEAHQAKKPAPLTVNRHVIRRKKETIPEELRWAVWERDDFTCQTCGTRKRLSVDHIIAESKGGPMTLANLRTLCRSCNSRKGYR